MQESKVPSYLLILIGAVLLVASLLADTTGIGSNPGFGPRQTTGSIAGAAILAGGLFFTFKKK